LESKISVLNLERSSLKELESAYIKILEEKERLQKENRTLQEKIDSTPSSKIVIFCENKNAELLNAL